MAERAGGMPKGTSASTAGQDDAADVTRVTTVTTAQKRGTRQAAARGSSNMTTSAQSKRGNTGGLADDAGGSGTTSNTSPIAARAAKGATMAKTAEPKTAAAKAAVAKAARGTRSAAETEKIRVALIERRDELKAEHDQTLVEIAELQQHRLTDSAGDDQADTGTKTFEREQEITLANNILERVNQVERALERLDEGGYGWCEKCGNAIPVERLAAFPSATLCVTCKQLEERR
ncbi:TraR/DksA family transcriptional regulator [Dactylosporangium siamense]|uniref:DNA-binding protein n=2 Tax=Dactylosporangium siamense TaxID=685454 RepID=A0A919UH54_9ACTN|nr:DNA-binding protein [Dactylosporangium siamense]